MPEGRLRGFVAGLGLGYLHTVTALVAALVLTPYLLGRLGAHDYGLWLIGAQVLAYLALMDVGIVALVPREVAFAVGQGRGADSPEVRALVGRTLGVVAWQVPFVVAAAAVTWWWLPAEWTLVRGPLGVALLGFVVLFPLRVFVALLQGLQDLAYLGTAQLAGLVVGTLATAGAVWAGLGLYALAIGWVGGQTVPAAMAWRRLRQHHPHVWPTEPTSRAWSMVRGQLSRGVWISVSQVAQALMTGTDVLVVGALVGPEAVVVYVCTGKLLSMLANQPQLLLQTALPTLSELRGAAARDRL
ncbi:MAG TPA: oligosaccharide flippase family protein, partial [Vicinamibacterales bacterium]